MGIREEDSFHEGLSAVMTERWARKPGTEGGQLLKRRGKAVGFRLHATHADASMTMKSKRKALAAKGAECYSPLGSPGFSECQVANCAQDFE